jgi:alkanesulfonate monooxygenase SsuD/methylene tetrahydromethanopterin reductase-like flavin-dependent oxidoreductase (luciferase family)
MWRRTLHPMTVVDIQFSPANTDWATLRVATLEAERRGYGAAMVFDHLAGKPLEGRTMLECFSLLGALAEVTSTIELGTMVANVWNRQVGTLVTAAASVALISGRRFHFGIGAGASPTSPWAAEQHATAAYIEPSIELRHQRVLEVLALADRQWSIEGRAETLSTFPIPAPPPVRIVGVNSERLSCLAGEHADGINIPWRHPRRDRFIAAANHSAGDRPFLRTAYTSFDRSLLDPTHPERIVMTKCGIDRLVLAVFTTLDAWLADPTPPS